MTKPCPVDLTDPDIDDETVRCGRPKHPGKNRCIWHWLLGQPIEAQERAARDRLERAPQPHRTRRSWSEWPPGERWCAGCQSMVPVFYTTGSRCKACTSRATHRSHVERTYDLPRERYDALLEWQGGRCYICRQVPRVRRLAVDHDHATGAVRGLLCANDEWGCNVALRRLLADPGAGERLMEYATTPPLQRMLRGDPPKPRPRTTSATMESLRAWKPFD